MTPVSKSAKSIDEEAMEVDEVAKKDKSVIDTTAGNKKYSDEDEV